MTSTADAHALVAAVAGYGLPAHLEGRDRLSEAPLPDGTWTELLGRCRSQRLTGFLALAVGDGALPTRPDQAEQAATAHREAMATVLLLERLLLDTTCLLTAQGHRGPRAQGLEPWPTSTTPRSELRCVR